MTTLRTALFVAATLAAAPAFAAPCQTVAQATQGAGTNSSLVTASADNPAGNRNSSLTTASADNPAGNRNSSLTTASADKPESTGNSSLTTASADCK